MITQSFWHWATTGIELPGEASGIMGIITPPTLQPHIANHNITRTIKMVV